MNDCVPDSSFETEDILIIPDRVYHLVSEKTKGKAQQVPKAHISDPSHGGAFYGLHHLLFCAGSQGPTPHHNQNASFGRQLPSDQAMEELGSSHLARTAKLSRDSSIDLLIGNAETVDNQICRSLTADDLMSSYSSIDDEMLAYLFPLEGLLDRSYHCDCYSELSTHHIKSAPEEEEAAQQFEECILPLSSQMSSQKSFLDPSPQGNDNLPTNDFQPQLVQNSVGDGETTSEQFSLPTKTRRVDSSLETSIRRVDSSGLPLTLPPYPATASVLNPRISLPENPQRIRQPSARQYTAAMDSCSSRIHQQAQQLPSINLKEGLSLEFGNAGPQTAVGSSIVSGGVVTCSSLLPSTSLRKNLCGCSAAPSESLKTHELVKIDMGRKRARSVISTERPKQAVTVSTCTSHVQEENSSSSMPEIEKVMKEPASTAFTGRSENIAENLQTGVASCEKRKTVESSVVTDIRSEGAENQASKEKICVEKKKQKRNRTAEVHNLSERRRRDRINEKMKALQELIPNSNKTDKASLLDEAIEYLKKLQLQLQIIYMSGMNLLPLVVPAGMPQYLPAIEVTNVPNLHSRERPANSMNIEMAVTGMTNSGSLQSAIPFPLSLSHTNMTMPSAFSDGNKPIITQQALDHSKVNMNYGQMQHPNMDPFHASFLQKQQQRQTGPLHFQI